MITRGRGVFKMVSKDYVIYVQPHRHLSRNGEDTVCQCNPFFLEHSGTDNISVYKGSALPKKGTNKSPLIIAFGFFRVLR
jgi:hypothetical protein